MSGKGECAWVTGGVVSRKKHVMECGGGVYKYISTYTVEWVPGRSGATSCY